MKKSVLLLVIFLMSGICFSAQGEPFNRPTKHKTVKRMTRSQVRKAQRGHTYYHRVNNQIKRNR